MHHRHLTPSSVVPDAFYAVIWCEAIGWAE